jgi:hypothetical protein
MTAFCPRHKLTAGRCLTVFLIGASCGRTMPRPKLHIYNNGTTFHLSRCAHAAGRVFPAVFWLWVRLNRARQPLARGAEAHYGQSPGNTEALKPEERRSAAKGPNLLVLVAVALELLRPTAPANSP